MQPIEISTEMIVVLGVLGFTILLFVTEFFRIDFNSDIHHGFPLVCCLSFQASAILQT